jgi:uncharacterized protein
MSSHDSDSDSGSSSYSDIGVDATATTETTVPKKRGRPLLTPVRLNKPPPFLCLQLTNGQLDNYKTLIIKQFSEDQLPIIDIARKLNLEHGLDISERTISRRLTAWGVPRKKNRLTPSQELYDRILFHYNKNLNDEQIAAALSTEGYAIKTRNLARLRQKLGMRRRSRYPEFREFSEEEEEPSTEPGASEVLTRPKAPPRMKNKKRREEDEQLIPKVIVFVKQYMSKYDGSHDFNHITRVLGLAHLIYNESKDESLMFGIELDLHVITLAALLHDVGDKKYLEPNQDANTLVLGTLLSLGADEELAIKVQRIVVGVSYSSEIKNPAQVQAMLLKYPELGVVQDADRLDAIGAVGIGRTFTFGGAKGAKHMGETIAHFEEKLLKLEGMMKTKPGRRLARERAERLNVFKGWWDEEQRQAESSIRRTS